MSLPQIVSREEWTVARKALLVHEKQLTRIRDELAADRRRLPMVEIEKEYVFEGPDGKASLLDLFEGRRQLIVRHFMFDPQWEDGCPSCTAGADEICDGLLEHLHTRETSFAVIARAPIAKIERYKHKRGWTFPWFSSFESDFNYDFHVTLDARVTPIEYNYRGAEEWAAHGQDWMLEPDQSWEQPGQSCFLRDGDRVFHTYSSFARGAEATGGAYYYLDETALGRQEAWEEPKDRNDAGRAAQPDFAT